MSITKEQFDNIFKNMQVKIKVPPIRVITQPSKEYSLIHLKRLGDAWFFRIIQNKKSGMLYFSYGKTYWTELETDLCCTPVDKDGKILKLKEVKNMLKPYLEDLEIIARVKIDQAKLGY